MRAAAYIKDYPVARDASAQRSRIEEYVNERGWELTAVYEDAGGLPWDHDALDTLLAELGGVDRVVVAGLDRLARRAFQILPVLDHLRDAGVDLISLDEGIDTGADTGRAAREVLEKLKRWESRTRLRPVTRWDVDRLAGYGFGPATVIDVGVADGTPPLYAAFPDAYLVLFDPLVEFEPELARIVQERPGEYFVGALGSAPGTATLEVDPNLHVSSVLPKLASGFDVQRREVPVTTLDDMVAEHDWKAPFGLKLDTEGSEMEVLRGASDTLAQTDFVISEVSVHERFEGACTPAELVAEMRTQGFELCDLLDADVTPLGVQADALFRRLT